ncbi:transposase family protein, partial [Lacticaseibacillus paracasei]
RQMVLFEAFSNCSLTDIARRFHVADKTVQRIIDEEAAKYNYHKSYGSRSIWLLMSSKLPTK